MAELDDRQEPKPKPKPKSKSKTDSNTKIYLAAAFGAFCLGFGDLLNNTDSATVIKIAEVIKQNLYPPLESGPLVALILIIVIGSCACWVHQPQTRVDAFARGFSVFAILTVIAPYQVPSEGLNTPLVEGEPEAMNFFSIRDAHATGHESSTSTPQPDETSQPSSDENMTTKIILKSTGADEKNKIKKVNIKLRDIKTGKIIGVKRDTSPEIEFKQPKGSYQIEVEAKGYRRSRAIINVTDDAQKFDLLLEKSVIPISVQRLYGADEIKIEKK